MCISYAVGLIASYLHAITVSSSAEYSSSGGVVGNEVTEQTPSRSLKQHSVDGMVVKSHGGPPLWPAISTALRCAANRSVPTLVMQSSRVCVCSALTVLGGHLVSIGECLLVC